MCSAHRKAKTFNGVKTIFQTTFVPLPLGQHAYFTSVIGNLRIYGGAYITEDQFVGRIPPHPINRKYKGVEFNTRTLQILTVTLYYPCTYV